MLPAGVDWRPALGERTRPIGPAVPIDAEILPDSRRIARDGTPYCVTCPRSLRVGLSARKVHCSDCALERQAIRAGKYRRQRNLQEEDEPTAEMHVRISVLDARILLTAIQQLQVVIATEAGEGARSGQDWHEQLRDSAGRVDRGAESLRNSLSLPPRLPGSPSTPELRKL